MHSRLKDTGWNTSQLPIWKLTECQVILFVFNVRKLWTKKVPLAPFMGLPVLQFSKLLIAFVQTLCGNKVYQELWANSLGQKAECNQKHWVLASDSNRLFILILVEESTTPKGKLLEQVHSTQSEYFADCNTFIVVSLRHNVIIYYVSKCLYNKSSICTEWSK